MALVFSSFVLLSLASPSSYFDTALHLLGPRFSMGPVEREERMRAAENRSVTVDTRFETDWTQLRVASCFLVEYDRKRERIGLNKDQQFDCVRLAVHRASRRERESGGGTKPAAVRRKRWWYNLGFKFSRKKRIARFERSRGWVGARQANEEPYARIFPEEEKERKGRDNEEG